MLEPYPKQCVQICNWPAGRCSRQTFDPVTMPTNVTRVVAGGAAFVGLTLGVSCGGLHLQGTKRRAGRRD